MKMKLNNNFALFYKYLTFINRSPTKHKLLEIVNVHNQYILAIFYWDVSDKGNCAWLIYDSIVNRATRCYGTKNELLLVEEWNEKRYTQMNISVSWKKEMFDECINDMTKITDELFNWELEKP